MLAILSQSCNRTMSQKHVRRLHNRLSTTGPTRCSPNGNLLASLANGERWPNPDPDYPFHSPLTRPIRFLCVFHTLLCKPCGWTATRLPPLIIDCYHQAARSNASAVSCHHLFSAAAKCVSSNDMHEMFCPSTGRLAATGNLHARHA
jgi:hypothetical protein